jgi:hypothetical protein
MDDPKLANGFVTIACCLVVALYAAKRYNTPATNRLTTTRSLFLLTGAGYIAASLMIFFILSEIVLQPGVLPFLGLDDAKKFVETYSAPPVLAAVILTTLLPNVPVISAADTWLLERFQVWGRIPHGVRILADKMTPNALPLSQQNLSDLQTWITGEGDIPNELAERVSDDAAGTSRGNLTRLLRLYHELEKLSALPAYAWAFRARQDAWQAIREDFRVFAAQSQAFFILFDRLAPLEGAAGADALKQARDRYQDICRTLYGHMAELLAQMLLIAEGSDLRIENRLKSVGFDILEPTSPPLPIGPFVFIGVVMIFAILGLVAVVPTPHTTPLPPALIAVLIGTTKTIGIVAAVLPKLRWGLCRRSSRGGLPYLAWLVSAGAAAVVAFLFERTALAVATQTAAAAFNFAAYPLTAMAPTTFVICLAIAILCDVDLGLGHGVVRRITEAMLCGTAMVVSVFICLRLLKIQAATAGQAEPWVPFALSFSLGLLGGFYAPYLYRHAYEQEQQTQTSVAQPA